MDEIEKTFGNALTFRAADISTVALTALAVWAREDVPSSANQQYPFRPIRSRVESIYDGIDSSKEGKRVASEAVAWLLSHGLLAEDASVTVGPGSLFPTRLGHEIAKTFGPGSAAAAVRVIELMPTAISARIIPELSRGDYDVAIATAFKAIEVRMRERAGLSTHDFGSRLARKFFQRVASTALQQSQRHGDLSDEEHLFVGALGLYRDRAVHEAPHIDSLPYALEVIVIAGHLLRIVEAADIFASSSS